MKRNEIIVSLEGMKLINGLSREEHTVIDETIKKLKKDKKKIKGENKCKQQI